MNFKEYISAICGDYLDQDQSQSILTFNKVFN